MYCLLTLERYTKRKENMIKDIYDFLANGNKQKDILKRLTVL